MKSKIYVLFLALFLSAALSSTAKAGADTAAVSMPPVESFVLGNGIKVFAIRDELPRFAISVTVGYGKMYEKKDTAGLSDLMVKVLNAGGSKKYPSSKLFDKIESLGGKISINTSFESTVIYVEVLQKYSREALEIVYDLLKNPNMTDEYIDQAKNLLSEEIKRKSDEPDQIALERTRELVFGGESYGARPTPEGIRAYTSDRIEGAWRRYFQAGNIMIGVASPVEAAEVKSLLSDGKFADIENTGPVDYQIDSDRIRSGIKAMDKKIFFYKKNISQATIAFGTLSEPLLYDGNYALTVMNYILGGGSFSSRLLMEIRVKRGLAYVVQSVIRPRKNTGIFLAFTQTRTESVPVVLDLLNENISAMAEKNVSSAELSWAKESISNSYIFKFDTTMNLMNNYLELEYNKLPLDYHANYIKNISAVTADDVKREAGLLRRNGFIRVVVGNPSLEQSLKQYGEVVPLN